MHYTTTFLVLTVVALTAAGTAQAEVLGNETWQTWSLTEGRQQNEPLDGSKHLTDSRLAVGLNKSVDISRVGYTFSQEAGWAFTLKPSKSWQYWDFTDSSITPDLQFDQRNNSGGSFRVLIANAPGDQYAASSAVYNYVAPSGGPWFQTESIVDLANLSWLSFDPATSTVGASVTPDFSSVYEVGFTRAGDRQYSRIDNILIQGLAVPEPSSAILLAAGLLGLLACGRRGHGNGG